MGDHSILMSRGYQALDADADKFTSLLNVEDVDRELRRSSQPDRQWALRAHRNTLIPISRLPPEVLLQIFRFCAPIPPKPDLAFCQTCRYWRTLAQDDRQLWRIPDFSHPALAAAMLVYARDAPLVVKAELNSSGDQHNAQVALIKETMANGPVEILELTAAFDLLEEFTRLLFVGKSQSVLRQVSLENTTSEQSRFFGDVSDLTRSLFPHLRHVRLRKSIVPSWIANGVCSLTTLDINLSSITIARSHSRENLANLLSVLSGNPNLERLTLIEATVTSLDLPPDFAQYLPRFHMQHLKHLHICDKNLLGLLLVLGLLELPALTSLQIEHASAWPPMSAAVASRLVYVLDGLVSSVTAKVTDVQDFAYERAGRLHFRATCHATSGEAEERLTFEITLNTFLDLDCLPVIHKIPLCFPLENLESCTIETDEMDVPESGVFAELWTALAVVPTITEIKAVRCGYHELLDSFQVFPPNNYRPWFPSLRRLDIVDANLEYAKYSRTSNTWGSPNIHRLASLLQSLEDNGRPLPAVTLDRCLSASPVAETLRKFHTHMQELNPRMTSDLTST